MIFSMQMDLDAYVREWIIFAQILFWSPAHVCAALWDTTGQLL